MNRTLRIDAPGNSAHIPAQGLRVALYSHDTMGLGHLRRNLLIAEALSAAPLNSANLLVTGALETNFFRLPEHTDCLTLPRWSKDAAGNYSSARLGLDRRDLVKLRSESICAALDTFAPDLLLVDKVPTGAFDELLPALRMLSGGRTRIVLGLRDVLDDPQVVAEEWLSPMNEQVLERLYDEIWVYGDPAVYNAVTAYSLPPRLAAKTHFTGYLDQSRRVRTSAEETERLLSALPTDKPLSVCVVGGGQDGVELALQFAAGLPAETQHGVIVAGPLMCLESLAAIRRAAAGKPNLTVFDFLPEADALLERADQVVAMAGYNTVCSLLSFGKRALLVPRVRPRREQTIRAQRLAELGLCDTLPLESLTPQQLREWLLAKTRADTGERFPVEISGLETVCRLAQRLTAMAPPRGVLPSAPLAT